MFAESLVAFILILAVTLLIYLLGRCAAPKSPQTENEQSEYACGEKAPVQKLRINVTLYKFLIYFAIFDSTILLLAFSSLLHQGLNVPLLLLYLAMAFAASLILLEGAREQ
ncbi:MAG: NADH-quinone oxidoreductase subunit A [Candidatus Bathyarchaeota archaeon]|nr:NADH-quinone oxidoreductase subunit A [Candidatus Bathyarchaeota archaeon]